MEAACLLQRVNNGVGGVPVIQKGEMNPEMTGSVMMRKRLSDITNLRSNGRLSSSDAAISQENAQAAPSMSSKDHMAHLLKENATLMMLVGERNKIIELRGVEMQKLRFALQSSNQQNQQLARANSQMIVEHNRDKDRLKTLHHELGCTAAVLNAKNLELEEKDKLITELWEMVGGENATELKGKIDTIAGDAPIPVNNKKACNPRRKRTLRHQSLGSATLTHQVTAKEKDESKRRSLSLRRRSSNLKTEDLFEIEDIMVEDAKVSNHSLASDPTNEHSSERMDTSDPSISISSSNSLEEEKEDQIGSLRKEKQEVPRTSIGRPMRRATEKICSYKEVPLNIKMRRPE